MSADSPATVVLALASSTCFLEAEILCTFFVGILYPRSCADDANYTSERLEPDSPPPPPRHGRTTGRNSTGSSQHHTSRTSGPHTAAPEPMRSRGQHRPRATVNTAEEEIIVDAIFSAHSDGLMVILRHASPASGGAQPPKSAAAAGSSKSGSLPSLSLNTRKSST